jgi:hypothetical protein
LAFAMASSKVLNGMMGMMGQKGSSCISSMS